MTNDLLLIDTIAQNIKTEITALNNAFQTKLYDTTISLVRGKYGFNVIPIDYITREYTDVSSLPNIRVDLFCYYTMKAEEKRDEQWTVFLHTMNKVRNILLTKAKIPSTLATVKIDVNFHDDLLDIKAGTRAINCVMSFTYMKYALNV